MVAANYYTFLLSIPASLTSEFRMRTSAFFRAYTAITSISFVSGLNNGNLWKLDRYRPNRLAVHAVWRTGDFIVIV